MNKDQAPAETAKALDMPTLAYRAPAAAKALGIGVRLLWEKTNSGEIPCVRIGRTVVYPVHMLREWLTQRAMESQR